MVFFHMVEHEMLKQQKNNQNIIVNTNVNQIRNVDNFPSSSDNGSRDVVISDVDSQSEQSNGNNDPETSQSDNDVFSEMKNEEDITAGNTNTESTNKRAFIELQYNNENAQVNPLPKKRRIDNISMFSRPKP